MESLATPQTSRKILVMLAFMDLGFRENLTQFILGQVITVITLLALFVRKIDPTIRHLDDLALLIIQI